jgi:GT2 family glycosyltransferase
LQLSVIIVNYNVQYFLEQCLVSVINACANIDAEILVVDNCSTDGSKAFFNDRFNEVIFIWQTENTGFSRANNLAVKQAKGDIILFLNPDTLIPENCLEKCLQFYTTQPCIGALGIHMIDGSGQFLRESKRGFPSPVTSLFKLAGMANKFPSSKIFARYYLGHLPEKKTSEVDVISGAFMMVSKKILDSTGGFDEVFFMYGEDIDLSYRIQKAGCRNFYFVDCSIIHFKGESTKKQTAHYIRTFYGAMKLFVNKHYSKAVAIPFTIVIEIAILLKQFIATIKRWYKKFSYPLPKKPTTTVAPLHTLIVADETDYTDMAAFFKSSAFSNLIIGRVAPNLHDANAIGNLEQLPHLISQHHINHIVFCTNGNNVNQIMLLMQQVALSVSFSFHLKVTSSIVGSNDKNSSGYFVAGL